MATQTMKQIKRRTAEMKSMKTGDRVEVINDGVQYPGMYPFAIQHGHKDAVDVDSKKCRNGLIGTIICVHPHPSFHSYSGTNDMVAIVQGPHGKFMIGCRGLKKLKRRA